MVFLSRINIPEARRPASKLIHRVYLSTLKGKLKNQAITLASAKNSFLRVYLRNCSVREEKFLIKLAETKTSAAWNKFWQSASAIKYSAAEIDSLACIRKSREGDERREMLCWHFYSFIFLRSCHVVIHTRRAMRASKMPCSRFSQDALTLHAYTHTPKLSPLSHTQSRRKKAQITPVPSLTQKPPPQPPPARRLRLLVIMKTKKHHEFVVMGNFY